MIKIQGSIFFRKIPFSKENNYEVKLDVKNFSLPVARSLQKLAENRLADNLLEYGFQGWRIGDKIPPVSSDSIFDELCYRRVGDHMVPEMMRRLEVRNVILSQSDWNQHICDFLKKQNLEKLLLLRWPRGDLFYRWPYVLENGDEEFRMNIIASLKKLLGPESQKQLKTLHIAPDICRFIPDWVRPLGEMLPSLTCLCLEGIHIGNEFADLCETCPNLNKLNISNSGVHILMGISKMPNLEVLDISNLRFENKEAIREIFNLKKLRVLDLGTSRAPLGPYSNNLRHYLSCGQTHGELRFIDVYGNDIGNSDLERLVNTHPMLVQIGLISTPLEKMPLMQFTQLVGNPQKMQRTIEFLTMQNMQCCLSALENYVRPKMAREKHPLICIFEEIELQLEGSSLAPDGKDVNDCFRVMLDLLELELNDSSLLKETYESTVSTIRVLNILRSERRYLPYWSKKVQLFTASALFEFVLHFKIKQERMDSYEYKLKCEAWTFFYLIVRRSVVLNQYLDTLCKEAVDEIVVLENMQSPFFQLLLKFLLRALRKMTPEMKLSGRIQSEFLGNITDVISGNMMEGLSPNGMEMFTDIVYQLMRLGRHRPNWDHLLHKKSIRVIVDYMVQNPPLRNVILGRLEGFLKYMDSTVCRVFFESRIHSFLTELMIHVDTRRAAISLLIKVYMFKEIRTYVTFVSAIPKYDVLIDEMMAVLDGIEDADTYEAHFRRREETGQYTNAFTFYYWLAAQVNQNGVSITWPEIEYAPRPKRRRIDN
ncbi:hypothetical protein B9Z55_024988 [Caenorhabditis nigoni]|uniref:Uncharacterized protein n=1 Tax=Caenorhabditis nigoni TaxID=1611254 RepID=A0A2G5SWM1_9PELO|nr:hypothetical protein B9Z55_024988 [Caenorhabditis nigoni]